MMNIIIHGFGGTTAEVQYLNDFLAGRGLNTRLVVLAGHGGTKSDLHKTSHIDWLKSAYVEVAKLKKEYGEINLIGFSMGGLIAANIAERLKVRNLVFINTPIYFWNVGLIIKNILSDLRDRKRENIDYFRKSVFNVSFKSSIEFLRILFKTKRRLHYIRTKSLILQCREDETVRHKSAQYIKRKLGKNARLTLYEGGCHQIFTKSPILRDAVCADIYNFIVRK